MKSSATVVALVFLLAGCSGGGSTTTPVWPTCPGGGGAELVDTQARLISPAAGATGVSPTIGSITVGYSLAPPILWGLTLYPSDNSGTVAASIPAQAQLVQSPGVVTLSIPVLKPGKTYSVGGYTYNLAHVPCFTPMSAIYGSFTTQ